MLARFWRYPFQQTGFDSIPAASLPSDAFRSSSFFPSNRQNAFAFVSRTSVNYERTGGRTEDRSVEIGRVRRAENESDRCRSDDDTRTMTKRFRFRFQKSERAFPFARLSDYAVYKITNVRKRYRAPFPWGICLRSTNTAPKSKTIAERGETGLKVIAFHSEKSRACWLTAMRLAKVIERSFIVFPIFFPRFSFSSVRSATSCSSSSSSPQLLRAEIPLPLRTLVTVEKTWLFAGALTSVCIGRRGYRWSMPRCFLSRIISRPFSFATVTSEPRASKQIWLALIRFVSFGYSTASNSGKTTEHLRTNSASKPTAQRIDTSTTTYPM